MRNVSKRSREYPDLCNWENRKNFLGLVNTPRVLIRDKFYTDDLVALMSGQLLAIRRKNYFPADKCQDLADKLLGSHLYGRYRNAPEIGRVGVAFFECQADEASRKRYEENAVTWIRELRDRCSPFLSPFDRFRLELDEAWAAGAHLNALHNVKMFGGLVRHFDEGSEAEAHQDVLEWDEPGAGALTGIVGQLAWNTYLTVPSKGGTLSLWEMSFSKEEYEERKISDSYGLRRQMLPEPAAVLTPEVGEMILFNSGRVHAVDRIECGSRVTWSAFAGYGGIHDPILIWS
jgi:hypothetical protein